MPDHVEYKGWVIEAQSYKSDDGRWRPKALLIAGEGGHLIEHHVPAPLNVTRTTEKQADAYAVLRAKKWIDDRG
jgi:hypothetical protein